MAAAVAQRNREDDMTRGRDLPSYITRRKRDGVLLFRKRDGARIAVGRLRR